MSTRQPSPKDVRDFLVDAQMAGHLSELEDAIGWIVVSYDPEIGMKNGAPFAALCGFGICVTPEEALTQAEEMSVQANRNLQGDQPWQYGVLPLFRVRS